MAIPKVFVSSTCYDLKYIRENLRLFIKTFGYESVLSEDGDVFYDPKQHTHDACITEIPSCQIFVLIIGGRSGGNFKDTEKSITNMEYSEAIQQKIPVFTLIEDAVYKEHHLYTKNKENPAVQADEIEYPSIDDIRIFSFIDEVRKNVTNNAFCTFNNYGDIENYLKKQWAGMMYKFLTEESESRRVSTLFEQIQNATEKIEIYTKQTARAVGNDTTNVIIDMYDKLLQADVVRELKCWNLHITPALIIQNDTLDDLCNNEILIETDDDTMLVHGGPPYRASQFEYNKMVKAYTALRDELYGMMTENNLSISDITNYPKEE